MEVGSCVVLAGNDSAVPVGKTGFDTPVKTLAKRHTAKWRAVLVLMCSGIQAGLHASPGMHVYRTATTALRPCSLGSRRRQVNHIYRHTMIQRMDIHGSSKYGILKKAVSGEVCV